MPGLVNLFKSDVNYSKSPYYIKYGIPLLFLAAITAFKLYFFYLFGAKTPFLLYFGIVIIVARYFGKRAAILIIILAAILVDYFFVGTKAQFTLNGGVLLQLFLFMLEGVLVISLSSAYAKAMNLIYERDRRFKAMVEKSSEGIIMINPDGRILYCSPSVEGVLGYSPEEFLAFEPWELTHPDEVSEVKENFFRLASHPDRTITLIHRMIHKNGSWAWIESKTTNLLNEPMIYAMISNFSNITDRVKLEKQREDFVSIASHELKTPLTSLKAYTQVLQSRFKENPDQTTYSIVNKIEHQANRVIRMVTDLLDVTTMQEGKLTLRYSVFNFNNLANEIVESLQQTTVKHQVITDFADIGDINADRERISQVITNLLSNAIKYSPDSVSILVSSKIEKSYLVFSVQDYGIGIPQADIDKIFERFYRVEEAKKTFKGLGLGLFICMQIIEQHQGVMGVESQENKGSEFWFTLPVGGED